MPSESARATSAAESRFRLDAPNSRPRALTVVALDTPSEAVVRRLSERRWNGASFLTASAFSGHTVEPGRFSMAGWLSDLAGRTKDLIEEVGRADAVVMIGSVGHDMQPAAIIAEACQVRHVMTTVMILGSATQTDDALARALAQLRPYASMLVIANDEGYLADMLAALRA